MTTNWTVKLTHGSRELDLNSGRYQPTLDFIPPAVATVPLIASGTSANRYGGGEKVGERALNRQWTLTIRVKGSSDAEVSRGGRDLGAFLALAGTDPTRPLYLQVRANSDIPFEPLWGNYGANQRFEVIHASPPQVASQYARGNLRASRGVYTSTLTLKPYALGKDQEVLTGRGTIQEDNIGWQDGFSRGLIATAGIINVMTNPVFGNATWNFGWTAGGDLTVARNDDKRFVLYGLVSARVEGTGATNLNFTQSIDVGSTNTHSLTCYAKLPDGGAVSDTQIELIYGAATVTETYTAIGDDGWYRISAQVTGIASAQATGCRVKNGYIVYVDGFQIEDSGHERPFIYGDMMEASWATTAHASTSSSGGVELGLPISGDTLIASVGSIRVVVKANVASADLGGTDYLFYDVTSGFSAAYVTGTTDWRFTDGTNTADSANATFSIGDVIVLHFTWSTANGIKQYVDGSVNGTNGTFTTPGLGATLNIGSDDLTANHGHWTFLDFATYDRELTAAQVTADYDNITQVVSDNQNLSPIPWLWTKDGDDTVDNFEDATNDTHLVIGGVPGSAPAITKWDIAMGQSWGGSTEGFYLSLLDLPVGDFIKVGSLLHFSGSTQSVGTSATTFDSDSVTNRADVFVGRSIFRLVTMTDAGSNLLISQKYAPGAGSSGFFAPEFKAVTTDGTARSFLSFPVEGHNPLRTEDATAFSTPVMSNYMKRSTGTANVTTGTNRVLFRPMWYATSPNSASGTTRNIVVKGLSGALEEDDIYQNDLVVLGDAVDVLPNRTNVLIVFSGAEGQPYTSTDTATFDHVIITPRYSIL